jgi:predicted DCC family thiol-disulfide oxidoreductase YuxK
MGRPAPILLAYDGECARCRRLVDEVQRRDRWGLLVAFPLQNAELLRMAPELAGRPLQREIHAVDTGNRRVWAGAEVLPQILRRLPRWRIIALLMSLPGVSFLAQRIYLRLARGRNRFSGGTPIR